MLNYVFIPFSGKGLADERSALLLDQDYAFALDTSSSGRKETGRHAR